MSMQQITGWLQQVIGLDASALGNTMVRHGVRRRMRLHDVQDVQAYWRLLQQTAEEQVALIDAVTVPESWFFRYPEAFRLMCEHVCGRSGRRRLLSIPCAGGEEPYSMAMSLLDAGLKREDIHIDALDISRKNLERARRGRFSQSAFRGAEGSYRQRYFRLSGREYELHAEVRAMVQFREGNMLQLEQMQALGRYDVIFCRNLLIYFDEEHRRRSVALLASMLHDDGLLFVGHAETGLIWHEYFQPVPAPMSFAYRRVVAEEKPVRTAPRPARQQTAEPGHRAAHVLPADVPQPREPDLQQASRLADQGRLTEAMHLCERWLQQHGASVEGWLLKGLLCDIRQQDDAAETAFRRVLYLQPDHQQAMLHLAFLLDRRGDSDAAQRMRERARRIHERQARAGQHG